jgi:hypothetical protein
MRLSYNGIEGCVGTGRVCVLNTSQKISGFFESLGLSYDLFKVILISVSSDVSCPTGGSLGFGVLVGLFLLLSLCNLLVILSFLSPLYFIK